jgi:hypothetical protein
MEPAKMEQQQRPVEQVVVAIEALDLDPVKVKLMNREEGEGWSREYVDQMEIAYKRFLTLVVKYPEETIAPSKDVDKFWHGHILDTMKYEEDCRNVFGFFLHHFPYFGMRGEEDAANLAKAGRTTARLYEYEFNAAARTRTSVRDEAAMCGATQPVRDVLNTSVRPTLANDAAMCGAKVEADAAMCGAKIDAAMCGAKIDAAMCGAKIDAAMCGAKIEAAMCGAKIDTVMCGAKIDAAMCGATVRPAMCGAKIDAAMCGAKIDTAMCGAKIPVEAAIRGARLVSAMCGAKIANDSRMTLAA